MGWVPVRIGLFFRVFFFRYHTHYMKLKLLYGASNIKLIVCAWYILSNVKIACDGVNNPTIMLRNASCLKLRIQDTYLMINARFSDFQFYLSNMTIARNGLRIVCLRYINAQRSVFRFDIKYKEIFDVKYNTFTLNFICPSKIVHENCSEMEKDFNSRFIFNGNRALDPLCSAF